MQLPTGNIKQSHLPPGKIWRWTEDNYANAMLGSVGHSKMYKITKIKMGSSCTENGENKNHQKNNRMDSI